MPFPPPQNNYIKEKHDTVSRMSRPLLNLWQNRKISSQSQTAGLPAVAVDHLVPVPKKFLICDIIICSFAQISSLHSLSGDLEKAASFAFSFCTIISGDELAPPPPTIHTYGSSLNSATAFLLLLSLSVSPMLASSCLLWKGPPGPAVITLLLFRITWDSPLTVNDAIWGSSLPGRQYLLSQVWSKFCWMSLYVPGWWRPYEIRHRRHNVIADWPKHVTLRRSWIAVISKCSEVFLVSCSIEEPLSISFLLWLLQAAPKNHGRRQEAIQEATAHLAAASKISLDAAAVAGLTELDGIFILNKEQRTALMAFLRGNDSFAFLVTDFGKGLVKHCCTLWLNTGQGQASETTPLHWKKALSGC